MMKLVTLANVITRRIGRSAAAQLAQHFGKNVDVRKDKQQRTEFEERRERCVGKRT